MWTRVRNIDNNNNKGGQIIYEANQTKSTVCATVFGPKGPKILVIDNGTGKIKCNINTKGKHGIPRETRFLGFFYCQPTEVRYKHLP